MPQQCDISLSTSYTAAMFSLAYVLLPFSDTPPAEAIATSLSRYQGGRRGDVPDDWLRFDDETAELRNLFNERLDCTLKAQLSIHDSQHSWHLNAQALADEMRERGLSEWHVRISDIEPNFENFVERFTTLRFERHPVTHGYGIWRNGLGQWDYWELGGRHDGMITGQESRRGDKRSTITSGPSRVRDTIQSIAGALRDALDQEPPLEIDVRSDSNIEMVSTLLDDLGSDRPNAVPGAILLPPDAVADELRWIKKWPHLSPVDAVEWLGLPADAEWRAVVEAAYRRFPDHWAAGISLHH